MSAQALDLAVDALAVHRLSRLVVDDVVLDRPRNALGRWAEENNHPMLDYWLGCHWCVSIWIATGVVLVGRSSLWRRRVAPALALSAVAGLIAERA